MTEVNYLTVYIGIDVGNVSEIFGDAVGAIADREAMDVARDLIWVQLPYSW